MGTVTPTTGLETPRCSILAMRRGRAASEEEVEKISRYSRARYFISWKMFTPATSLQDAAEDDDDEQCAGDVERDHQGDHADDGLEAGGADHGGDGTEGADRGEPHDHDQDAEDQGLAVPDGVQDRRALRAHLLQGEADQDGARRGWGGRGMSPG